jgi:large subunit ribosomal protein L18
MGTAFEKTARRRRAHARIRNRVSGTPERPRLAVFKSSRYLYAQVIDDLSGNTLVQANSREQAVREATGAGAMSKAAARAVGETLAERALAQGIERVVFDRGGYLYHGRVQQLAEGARSKGLQF